MSKWLDKLRDAMEERYSLADQYRAEGREHPDMVAFIVTHDRADRAYAEANDHERIEDIRRVMEEVLQNHPLPDSGTAKPASSLPKRSPPKAL